MDSDNSKHINLTIDRSRWIYGDQGIDTSLLLRAKDNKMCCLGFLAKACGASDDEIMELASPAKIPEFKQGQWPDQLKPIRENRYFDEDYEWGHGLITNTKLCTDLMFVNDDKILNLQEREELITKFMLDAGVTVTFV